MTKQVFEGGCLCRAVRYRAQGPALVVEYCHCEMCRRAGGAPVVVWADFPKGNFALLQGAPAHYASSPGVGRGFCAACGSTLTFEDEAKSYLSVAVGTLDDPGSLAPRQHIFFNDRIGWLEIAGDLPRHPQAGPRTEEA